jgi:hypothetical protein
VLATLLEVLGLVLVVAGCAQVSVPLAFVTAGMLLIIAAVALDRSRAEKKTP